MRTPTRLGWLAAGLLLFGLIWFLPSPAGLSVAGQRAAAVTVLMAVWWMTEAIPIYATALIPLALFPLLGVLPADLTAQNYGHNYVLMLLGGFFIARAIEHQGLHRRLALGVIRTLGNRRSRILLGFMLTTAFLSMWMTNVAVVLMMLPIATAVITRDETEAAHDERFGIALLLGIAYAASVGGTGTLIGTPPTMVMVGMLEAMYPQAPEISFFAWMQMALPLVAIFLPIIWWYLIRYYHVRGRLGDGPSVIRTEWEAMGRMHPGERRVFVIFVLTALGWIFRRDWTIDQTVIPGWGTLLGVADYVHDSTVAILGALALFILPDGLPRSGLPGSGLPEAISRKRSSGKRSSGKRLLDWNTARTIPWGVALLLGGGFAIATAFRETGLATWIGEGLSGISTLPTVVMLALVVGVLIFLTEINSNTATATIFLPILGTMAVAGSINPLLLMIPATFACSFAFMLPSGTGTNTVIFGSGRLHIQEMARCGLGMNLISWVLLTLLLLSDYSDTGSGECVAGLGAVATVAADGSSSITRSGEV